MNIATVETAYQRIDRGQPGRALSRRATEVGAYEELDPTHESRFVVSPKPLHLENIVVTEEIILPELVLPTIGDPGSYTYKIPYLSKALEAMNFRTSSQQIVPFNVDQIRADFFTRNPHLNKNLLQGDENWMIARGKLVPIFFD